jgi:serine acetyltransferase
MLSSEIIFKMKRKLKNILAYILFQYPRILFFKFISNCSRIIGKAKINQPVQLSGMGIITFGKNVNLGVNTSPYFYSSYGYIEARKNDSQILIKDNVWINNNFIIISDGEGIEIGEKTLIGINFEVTDSDFHDLNPKKRTDGTPSTAKVIIGKNVFIGSNVKILKGVYIGDNSVIANGSIVTKSIPTNVVAGGNPCKIIKELIY